MSGTGCDPGVGPISLACRRPLFPNALSRPMKPPPPGVPGDCGICASDGLGVKADAGLPKLPKSSGEGGTCPGVCVMDERRPLSEK